MISLKLALDWTINTNHTGFVVAQTLKYYEAAGIELILLTPDEDNYAITPAKKVELGLADFALCPLESILSYQTKNTPFDAVAIASILQEDISSIVVLKQSGIESPKDLAGKAYASYKARYEDEMVKQMITNDGGNGEQLQLMYPEKLGIWNTLLTGKADATWVFDNWEGVEAQQKGIELKHFRLADFEVPYGYSPVIMTSLSKLKERREVFQKFLQATKAGFLQAESDPETAVEWLLPLVPENDRHLAFLEESQHFTNRFYGTGDSWGRMDPNRVKTFIDWIQQRDPTAQQISYQSLFTNELLSE